MGAYYEHSKMCVVFPGGLEQMVNLFCQMAACQGKQI